MPSRARVVISIVVWLCILHIRYQLKNRRQKVRYNADGEQPTSQATCVNYGQPIANRTFDEVLLSIVLSKDKTKVGFVRYYVMNVSVRHQLRHHPPGNSSYTQTTGENTRSCNNCRLFVNTCLSTEYKRHIRDYTNVVAKCGIQY